MLKSIAMRFVFVAFIFCESNNIDATASKNDNSGFISAVDISTYPEILLTNPIFYDLNGKRKDFLKILKENGVNTVRLRLWVNPGNGHCGFYEVKNFSRILKAKGFRIWLALHYSDTWADPGHQQIPRQWQGIDFIALKDSVRNYTEKIMKELQPDYIQIGNEINAGFLFPFGNISNNFRQFEELMTTAIEAVRANESNAKIIMHFAGIDGADWFFEQINELDYDFIGLSYYPIWHGKFLNSLKTKMQKLSGSYHKKIVIAETAYPFTLGWNDQTNNIVGTEKQLILPDYPATPEGQRKFVNRIKNLVREVKNGTGFCYWGAELIAWKGNQAVDGSVWENQALFDFDNKALPALREFKR
ncbi:MAG: arabinogalactan endo-1,4-beta-galactosidase [Candidatus Cloacimonadota bacterium]|nr:MAG: arabinogalactan endo-1,4-beta-galactosidase [Candidatus Cloacimonadota bacterium]